MTKPKIYLLHGWTYTLDKWGRLVEELSKQGFEPILLKVPGLTEQSDDVWDIPKYVTWLDTQLQGNSVYLLGQSNGGRIAMAYDVAHPGKLKHLFLISSAGVYDTRIKTRLKRSVAIPLAKILKPLFHGKVRSVLYRLIGGGDYGRATKNMRQTMINVTNFDKTFDPTNVSAPTTVIWGKQDSYTPLANAYVLSAKIPHASQPIVFEGVGHSSQNDKATEIAKIISDTINT